MTTVRALHEVPRPAATSAESPTSAEARAAALQYVRLVSGTALPTGPDRRAFSAAVMEIAAITQQLMDRAQERVAAAASDTSARPDHGSGLAAVC